MSAHRSEQTLAVRTQNLYLGVDIEHVLAVQSLDEIPARADKVYKNLIETDFPARVKALARGVLADPPEVMGLQEVACWQTSRSNGNDSAVPATLDFLELLLNDLRVLGLHYKVAAISPNGRGELPSLKHGNIRFLDRDVILVAHDLEVVNSRSGRYEAQAIIQVGGQNGPPVTLNRGWTSVDVVKNGQAIRVANTHLELPGRAQCAQARELFEHRDRTAIPLVLIGDLNADPDADGPVYENPVARRLLDVWRVLRGQEAGYTGCQRPDLANEHSALSERIDVIFCSPDLTPRRVALVGADERCRLPSRGRAGRRLWPSDHAGVQATLEVEKQ